MGRSICFTGHRIIPSWEFAKVLTELKTTLEIAAANGFTDYYAGGAQGWDTYCAQAVLDLKEKYSEVKLHLILPCPGEDQTASWSRLEKRVYEQILIQADSCEILNEGYTATCMSQRNQRLVDMADCCVCYYQTGRYRSGTAQTIRMAKQKGIPIINLAERSEH